MKSLRHLLILIFISVLFLFFLQKYFNSRWYWNKVNIEFMDSMDYTEKKYIIGPSNIHGNGVICTDPIEKDERIDVAIIVNSEDDSVLITPEFGALINHKKDANAILYTENGEMYYLVANRDISPTEEITANYDDEGMPSFIDGSKPEYIH